MFRIGFDGAGWLRTLVESIRICSDFPSLTRTTLLMEASNDQEPGSCIPARPSEPRVPGLGFCSTICPLLLAMAWSVHSDFSSVATVAHCGSGTLVNDEPR